MAMNATAAPEIARYASHVGPGSRSIQPTSRSSQLGAYGRESRVSATTGPSAMAACVDMAFRVYSPRTLVSCRFSTAAVRLRDGEQPPLARDTLQRMRAAIEERHSRPGH